MTKVLVVEDNDLNLKLFRDLLYIQKCDVILCKNGTSVPEIVQTDRPDLILMDIQLGNVSGIDLIKDLKNNPKTSNIPIIAITAYAMKNDETKILESGCDMYLSKPISIDIFFSAIAQFNNESLKANN